MRGKWGNLHTHTVYCDGQDTPEQLVWEALDKGFDFLGFSGHSYTDFDPGYCMSRENTRRYRREIRRLQQKYAGRIVLFCGIEQDYYSGEPTADYDYVIGAVHYIQQDGQYLPVDESAASVRDSVARCWNGDFYAWARDYYLLLADVVKQTDADIIGHFDLVNKFNQANVLFDEADPRYLEAAYAAADALLATGRPFEINTGAMARGLCAQPYPAPNIIEYIGSHGGSFILSSDCHAKQLLDYGFPDLADRYGEYLCRDRIPAGRHGY